VTAQHLVGQQERFARFVGRPGPGFLGQKTRQI
jgi:hypothetical protein